VEKFDFTIPIWHAHDLLRLHIAPVHAIMHSDVSSFTILLDVVRVSTSKRLTGLQGMNSVQRAHDGDRKPFDRRVQTYPAKTYHTKIYRTKSSFT
jgi:hypothetical protein